MIEDEQNLTCQDCGLPPKVTLVIAELKGRQRACQTLRSDYTLLVHPFLELTLHPTEEIIILLNTRLSAGTSSPVDLIGKN
jgi:hypothetical protein